LKEKEILPGRRHGGRKAIVLLGLLFAGGVLAAPKTSFSGSLLTVYQAALTHDPQLASARAQYQSEQERVPQARAGLLPSLALTGTGSRTHERIGLPGLNRPLDQQYNDWQYGIQISQPLLKPASWYHLREAHDSVQAAYWQLASARLDLMVRTTLLYFLVLRNTRKLATIQLEIKADQARRQQVKSELSAGISSLLDVNQVEAAYWQDRVKLIRQQGELRESYAKIEALTGQSIRTLRRLNKQVDLTTTVGQRSLTDWMNSVAHHNPKILTALATRQAALENV